MPLRHGIFAAACLLCLGPPLWAGKPARTDRFGDPLPEGAFARLGTTRLWHGAQVGAVAVSPDGKVVASGGPHLWRRVGPRAGSGTGEGRVCLWDAATGKWLRVLEDARRPAPITCLGFSPDGTLLAAGDSWHVLVLWDVAAGKLLHRLEGHEPPLVSVAFSADGKRLFSTAVGSGISVPPATLDSSEVGWWDVASGKKLRLWKAAGGAAKATGKRWEVVAGLALSPDAAVVLKTFHVIRPAANGGISYGRKAILRAYDTAAGGVLYQLHNPRSSGGTPVVSADGKRFAWGGNSLILGELATGKVLRKMELQLGSYDLALSPDGRRLAAVNMNRQVRLWDLAAGKELAEPVQGVFDFGGFYPFAGRTGAGLAAFSADGKLLAAGDGGSVRLIDVATDKERPGLAGHRSRVSLVRFGPGGSLTSACGRTFRRWDVAAAKETHRLGRERLGSYCRFLDTSADGAVVVCPAGGGSLELRDTASGKVLRRLRGPRPPDYGSGHFSDDGRRLAVIISAKGKLLARVYDTATGKEVKQVPLPAPPGGGAATTARTMRMNCLYQAALSPDGKVLAWAEAGGRTRLLDVASGKTLHQLGAPHGGAAPDANRCPYQLAFSPDGRALAAAFFPVQGDFPPAPGEALAVTVYQVRSGRVLRRVPFRREDGGAALLAGLAFSPDGRTLAAGSYGDDLLHLVELASGQERRTFRGGQQVVTALAFAPDGRALAAGGEDGTVLVWDMAGPGGGGRAVPNAARLEALWSNLASPDAGKAGWAVWALGRCPAASVPFLSGRLRPAAAAAASRLRRLIADLDSPHFAVRERAMRRLEQIGEPAEAALSAARPRAAGLEARRRVERLLERLRAPTPPLPRLRQLRAVEALEHMGTPPARRLLERLAGGEPASRLTREAAASLHRLSAGGGPPP
jgi:WD40 repeat protein